MQKGFSAIFIIVGVLILIGLGVWGYYFYNQQKLASIKNFDDCARNFPVMASYPGQCNTPDGRHFVQELSKEEKKKLIPPTQPTETQTEKSDESKKYRNEKLGYEFDYPSNWEVSTDEQMRMVSLQPVNYQFVDSEPALILIESADNPKKLNILDYMEEDKNTRVSQFNDGKLSESTYGNLKGYSIHMGNCEPNACDKFILGSDDKVIIFNNFYTSPPSPIPADQIDIFTRLITSFKFLN